MSGEMNRVIIPCSDSDAQALNDEFSVDEMRQILFDAYKERQKTPDREEDELASYSRVEEIRSDESLTPAERKRRELLWQRRKGR
jgi:hypothetical protein